MEADLVVVGAGLAGLVAAAEAADTGRSVVLVEQEGEQSLGGQAFWSLGGLFLVDSPEQRRMGVRDSPELAWQDWLGSAQLELVELGHYVNRYPHELSGGQQQRVALARALAHPPDLLLLDEPFSNLDAKLRERARDWLRTLQQRIGVTTVFVTHDQDEALSMSDRIVVMDQGRVRQIGTPEEVYQQPADLTLPLPARLYDHGELDDCLTGAGPTASGGRGDPPRQGHRSLFSLAASRPLGVETRRTMPYIVW